jgi:hypothetical protein
MEGANGTIAVSVELEGGSQAALEVGVDFGPLAVADQTREVFADLIPRRLHATGILPRLLDCRRALRDGGELRLANRWRGPIDAGYVAREEMLLNMAGFVEVEVLESEPVHTLRATRRPNVVEEWDHGMVLREVTEPAEILTCHEFAKEIYYYKDYNYDLDVVSAFPNADMYAVYDFSGRVIAIGRAVVRVPGYNCPFMYALQDDGSHYRVPRERGRIGEVMGLFREGRQGVVAFKRLMQFVASYAYEIARLDSLWTTYDANDQYTGEYYKTKLLMEETGARLRYGDFGGIWVLICTEKMAELRVSRRAMFRS